MTQLAQLTDGCRKVRQFVGCNVQLAKERVGKQGGRQIPESLAAHVQVVPRLVTSRLIDAVWAPPIIRARFARGGLAGGGRRVADSLVLGGLQPGIVMRLGLFGHGSVGSFRLFMQAQLFGPVFVDGLGLATPGGG